MTSATLHSHIIATQLQNEEERNVVAIIAAAQRNRPEKTIAAFLPKQREFIAWAESKGYENPSLVTEAKVALFLNSVVLERNNKKDPRKKIGSATVSQYITALTSLWKFQVSTRCNSHPSPRGESIKAIQKTMARSTYLRNRVSYADRGLLYQHLLVKETQEIRRNVAEYFWTTSSHSSTYSGLRNRVGYLLSEQGLLRGENIRDAELPDFFCVEMDGEGQECVAIVLLKGRGKTNQFGNALFSGYYRHSDVRLCAVSALALFLFYRWHMAGETIDFSSSQSWYNIVFFSMSPAKNRIPISYKTHANAIKSVHEKLGISPPKITHGGRYFGKQKLDREGVEKISANIAGGWSVGTGDACYGNGLDRPSMRAMSGFPPNVLGAYSISRATVKPPEELARKVFPWLEEWERRHREGDRCERNIALTGFLRLIRYLREVVLQDAAATMNEYPHPLWTHAIFQSTEFKQFKDAVLVAVSNTLSSFGSEIQRVIPQLCNQLVTRDNDLKGAMIGEVKLLSNKIEENHKCNEVAMNHIRDTVVRLLRDTADTVSGEHTTYINDDPPGQHAVTDFISTQIQEPTIMPRFEAVISEAVSNVTDVLMEWDTGYNGRPSVAAMESTYKRQWRVGTKNQKAFSRRRLIIGLIQRYAARRGITRQEAARLIEIKRNTKKISLIRLADQWDKFEQTELMVD